MFKKGDRANPAGRPRGSKNKTGTAALQMILDTLDKLGGIKYLEGVAKSNPQVFCALVGKVLPKNINLDVSSTTIEDLILNAQGKESTNGEPHSDQ